MGISELFLIVVGGVCPSLGLWVLLGTACLCESMLLQRCVPVSMGGGVERRDL